MKEIVNLPTALRKTEILPPVKRSDFAIPAFATIPGRATIVSQPPEATPLVPVRDKARNNAPAHHAQQAYGVMKKNTPELAGRIINILV